MIKETYYYIDYGKFLNTVNYMNKQLEKKITEEKTVYVCSMSIFASLGMQPLQAIV